MRRTLVAVALAGLFSASTALAQDDGGGRVQVVGQIDDAPMNVVGVQFHGGLALAGGAQFAPGVALKYERALSDMMSLAVQPALHFRGAGAVGFGLDLDLRFHIVGESLNGLYIAPTAGVAITAGNFGFNAGGLIGYSYLINNMVQIGVGVGFEYEAIIVPILGMAGYPIIPIRAGVGFAF